MAIEKRKQDQHTNKADDEDRNRGGMRDDDMSQNYQGTEADKQTKEYEMELPRLNEDDESTSRDEEGHVGGRDIEPREVKPGEEKDQTDFKKRAQRPEEVSSQE
jgi:hypothetical protein